MTYLGTKYRTEKVLTWQMSFPQEVDLIDDETVTTEMCNPGVALPCGRETGLE